MSSGFKSFSSSSFSSSGQEHPFPLCEGGGELPEKGQLWGGGWGREVMTPIWPCPRPSAPLSPQTHLLTWRTVTHDYKRWLGQSCHVTQGTSQREPCPYHMQVASERHADLHHHPKPSVPREASGLTGIKPQPPCLCVSQRVRAQGGQRNSGKQRAAYWLGAI